MKRIFTLILVVLCIFLLAFAISCNNNSGDTDTSTDTSSDTSTDTSSDTSTDTSSDTSTDTSSDTSTDTSSDTSTDTSSDTSTDTSSNTSTDSSSDTSTDTDGGNTDEPSEPVLPPVDPELQAKVDELLYSKHRLEYNEDGSFRVLILADLHMNTSSTDATSIQEVKDRVKFLVDKENPNLVIFTGDNIISSSSEEKTRANIDAIAGYLEEKQIPWCHVYGNHDHEGAIPNSEQQKIYESYEYCISKDTDGLSGTGNYVHAVYKADGTIGSVIYCLDSGAYDTVNGGYDYIKEDQIAWYKEASEILQEYNGGKVINGMMAFHIPLIENNTAYDNKDNTEIVLEWDGQKNENICASNTDTTLLETIFERGDVKAIVTGHDHINDYMLNYYGVKLTNSPNISDLTYHNAGVQGGRVFDLNADTVGTNIPTYVSYIVERLNPDDYDTLDNNVSLEFTKEQIENAMISNWNGGVLSGTATVASRDGKGVDGGDAIEITRSNKENFEISIDLTNKGKLGDNKYLIVWADFTSIELRKACFGLLNENGRATPYRTDDADYKTPFYYLADGETEWQELSHGADGCFGAGDSGSQGMNGKKGYFAFPVEYFLNGSNELDASSLISGLYFYGSLADNSQYFNVPFYFDDIRLVTDYKELFK